MVISRKGDLVLRRGQEEQFEKLFNHSNKLVVLSEVIDYVFIPISLVDKRTPVVPLDVPGVVLQLSEFMVCVQGDPNVLQQDI